jgi:iron complex transport system substrate-binding protein
MKYVVAVLFIFITLLSMAGTQAQEANLTDSCVENYDPSVDYFPDKAEVEFATGLQIEYFNNYKVIHVLTPWLGAEKPFVYVLVQCGTPAPEGFDDALVIEVPVGKVIATSTTQLPHLDQLGLLDHLVAVETFAYVYNENVRQMIEDGKLAEIGYGSGVNVEVVLDLDPDLVMTFGIGSPDYDAYPILLDAGVPTVLNAEWTDTSPLGRSEWIKFTAAFFNREADANQIFDGIVTRYQDIAALAADVEDRPTVFLNTPFEGTWYVPGAKGYMAALLADAGAEYLWTDNEETQSLYLDFESVFDRAATADFWLNVGYWDSLATGLAEDERYAEFKAFQEGNVFNNTRRMTPGGGVDMYESGVTNPDIVLADLVKIFHPELLPDHELFYYQKLD